MILKLIGLFLISVTGGLAGINASLRLKSRTEFLEKYISLLSETKTRIRLSACDIRELFKNDSGYEPLDFMTAEFTRNIKNKSNAKISWERAVNSAFRKYRLSKADKELISDFGTDFGKRDIDGEISHIDLNIALIEDRLEKARTELTQKGKLYRTLGIFGGITVSLIIL
ncbi:stage III sporulation protein AB [Pseudoruminococcus massiliensis]|uniref:stage III sporulation protein AB n=1 Tax=Pseudoruminococcus massiliensis TaxID=2086583 RepID=UPI000D0F9DB2|nr:stage III sporulation protein AB [Pseudoruminococcus massiliensis]